MDKYKICKVETDENVVSCSDVIIGSDDDEEVYDLSKLANGFVIKDSTDGTTGWKVKVSNIGDLSAEQVTIL